MTDAGVIRERLAGARPSRADDRRWTAPGPRKWPKERRAPTPVRPLRRARARPATQSRATSPALTRGRRHAGHLGLCRGADPPRYRCCPLVEEAPNDMLGMRYLVLFALLLSTFSGRMITVREEIAA
jgi:hypothetical protein